MRQNPCRLINDDNVIVNIQNRKRLATVVCCTRQINFNPIRFGDFLLRAFGGRIIDKNITRFDIFLPYTTAIFRMALSEHDIKTTFTACELKQIYVFTFERQTVGCQVARRIFIKHPFSVALCGKYLLHDIRFAVFGCLVKQKKKALTIKPKRNKPVDRARIRDINLINMAWHIIFSCHIKPAQNR